MLCRSRVAGMKKIADDIGIISGLQDKTSAGM